MQLYSGRECEVPSFYQKYGHLRIAGNLIDLDMPGPHNKAYAVIAAYWLRKGDNLQSTDNNVMEIGTVQYFLVHHLKFMENNERVKHIFAYVCWKQLHHNRDYFGTSAIVCEQSFEEHNAFQCNELPVDVHM